MAPNDVRGPEVLGPGIAQANRVDLVEPAAAPAQAPPSRWRPFAWLALPCLVYLVPLVLGFAWSSMGPNSPNVTGLEGYSGRAADVPITVETWGTGAVSVPSHARLAAYVRGLELPLWNPYQGLGQPYAAEGDGDPYSPFAVARALLPYSLSNVVTVLTFYLSSVCLYLFFRGLGVGETAAIVGGMAWPLSGALSLHVARPELSDQLVVLPILLWSAARAVRAPSATRWVTFAVMSGLNGIAGFIQIGMIAGVVAVAFALTYAAMLTHGPRAWLRKASMAIGMFVFGNSLVAFSLLPLAEALRVTSNRNATLLSFIDMPYPNLIAFFFPLVFGHFFQSWVGGSFPNILDWNNLYAYAGTSPLILIVVGVVSLRSGDRQKWIWFLFFAAAGVFLLLRYISFPLIAGFDLLPIFGRQSPKHSQGVAVLCLLVAATFAIDNLRGRRAHRVRGWLLLVGFATGSAVLTVMYQHGSATTIDAGLAWLYVPATLLITFSLLAAVWAGRRWRRLSSESAPILVGGAVVAEMTLYVPLGNASFAFLLARLGLAALIGVGALLLALDRRWIAGSLVGFAVVGYAMLVALPSFGLPTRFDADSPPPYMHWLQATAGSQYRSFGIMPDFSSIGALQDIGAVGPLAPREYSLFVDLISSQAYSGYYRSSSNLILTNGDPPFDLDQYAITKPIFDWFGIKYLVLDRSTFNPGGRTDDQTLLATNIGVQVAYDDGRIRVLESSNARPKAEFSTSARFGTDQQTIVNGFKNDPQTILGVPSLEASAVPLEMITLLRNAQPNTVTVDVVAYQPNAIDLHVDAPSPGVVVLKDSYFPGWEATLNGQPTDILRVDGIARGVIVPVAGQYDVRFTYRPLTFVSGVWLSALAWLLLAAVLAFELVRRLTRLAVADA